MPNAEIDQAKHEHALRLAKQLCGKTRDDQIAEVREWRRIAEDISDAVSSANRTVRERHRLATRRGGSTFMKEPLRELFLEVAIAAVKRAAGRDLVDSDQETLLFAIDEGFSVLREIQDETRSKYGNDPDEVVVAEDADLRGKLIALKWIVATSAYATTIERQLKGTYIVGVLGTGKENPALHVAALSLAELGLSPREIGDALSIDPAYARRLTRAARVS